MSQKRRGAVCLELTPLNMNSDSSAEEEKDLMVEFSSPSQFAIQSMVKFSSQVSLLYTNKPPISAPFSLKYSLTLLLKQKLIQFGLTYR